MLGSFIQQHRGEREGPFVCDERSGKPRTPRGSRPRSAGEAAGGDGSAPLKSSHLYHYLSCFSTSGVRQKNGALPRILREFRFLNH